MPQIQPMANTTYTININNPVITGIPGVTYASNILTFTTSVDPTDTYIITGTGTATTNRIVVNSGVTVNITLSGINITTLSNITEVSPFQLQGTADVNLTLEDGTTNILTCSYNTANTTVVNRAGLWVPLNAKLTIGGTGALEAKGGYGGSGIGGGFVSNVTVSGSVAYTDNAAGTIIINSGNVTATGGGLSAGIGGGLTTGNGGTITINGGTVIATAAAGGISTYAAGIGGGGNQNYGGNGGTITISGGTVIATGGTTGGTGIGAAYYGSGGTTTIIGGSVLPRTATGIVSAVSTPRNGTANGDTLLYMTTVTVVDASNIPVANALVSVEQSTYTYTAYTNASGVAYIWVPTGNQLFEGEHDDYGYGSTDATVAANNNNTVTIVLGMRTTLSRTPNTIAFISATNPTPVTLGVKAENKDTGALKDIISAQWFRVETTDTTYTASKTSFDSGFAAASSSNKGDDTTNLVETTGGTSSEKNYTMPVSENGKYWVLVHYKDGLGVDRYQVKSIVIDNIYTPSTGKYKGINSGDSSTLYDEATPSLTNASGDPIVGVAFELNSTATILTSTSDGTTAVAGTGATLTVNAKNLAPLWITSAPTSQTVSVTGTNLGTTTFNYTLNPLAITVQFDSQGGTPSTIANQYYMPTDTFGTLPTVAMTGYNLDGWFTATTGGSQVNATDTAGSHFTSGSTVTLYAGWTASAKTVTISNEVAGAYGNMDKSFTYTIYFQDSGGTALTSGTQFAYTGGVLTGSSATAPSGGTLTLGSGGEATVTLTTGQTITIAGIATSAKVRVVQTTDANYTTSFKDSEDASSTSGADTGVRSMTAADRAFDFTNTRSVVPGGISTGSGGIVLLSLMALALASGLAITAAYRRRVGAR